MNQPLHSPLGPSAAYRYISCPGSVLLTSDMPDHSSEYAIEGTAAHTLSEWCRNEQMPASHYLGQEIRVRTEDGNRNVRVDQEMVTNVQEFVDYVQQFGGESFSEMRVSYDNWIPGGFGTADDIRIEDNICRVTDLKYGKGVQVFAEDNPQNMLYALGVVQELDYLYDFDRFILTIHQPRLNHVDEWEISLDALVQWAEEVAAPAAALALKPGAPFKAGDWCKFCKARTTCKTRAKAVLETVLDEFEDLDHIEDSEVLESATLTNDQMAHVLPKVAMIKAWVTDLEDRAVSELLAGHQVGDFKLVEGRSSRVWANEAIAEVALRESKLEEDQIFVKKLITAPAAEKILGKTHPVMLQHVIKPRGKPTLVAGSDKRKPYEAVSANEFEILD